MKNIVKILFFCSIMIILVSHNEENIVFAQDQTEEQLKVLFNEATELFQNGNYNQANVIYDQILESSPNNISYIKHERNRL
tara:strand:+ start:146 stop:388 length:243 start_codon:yes stop_codon:yes gene_type:complete